MIRTAHSVATRMLAAALLLLSISCGEESGGTTHVVLISEMRMVLGTEEDGSLRGMWSTDIASGACRGNVVMPVAAFPA